MATAFVPGYEHDVFVSYAHANDLPPRIHDQPGNLAPGWVSTLVWHLKSELVQKIGRLDAFTIWLDEDALHGNQKVTAEISARLRSSATFVAVQSPAYFASDWCKDEARLFVSHCGDTLADRLFVVEKDPVDPEDVTIAELSGRRNYTFWYLPRGHSGAPQPLAYPMSTEDEIEYLRRIRALASDIHALLKGMGGRLYHNRETLPGPLTGASSLSASNTLPTQPQKDAIGRGPPLIFLNAEAHHHDIAVQIRDGIGDRAIWVEPSFTGPSEQVRETFERTLNSCDAMVTVYADNESWALTQLLAAHKLAAQNPGRKIPVIDAPPRDKPPLGIRNLPNMEVIDARNGVGPEALSRLRTCLDI